MKISTKRNQRLVAPLYNAIGLKSMKNLDLLSPLSKLPWLTMIYPPKTRAENFSTTLTSHLGHHLVIPNPTTQPSHRSGPQRERAILKLIKRLAKIKNAKRKDFTNDPRDFLTAVRLHNRDKKTSEKSKSSRETRRQERDFQNNPWSYSKSVCNTTSSKVIPKSSSDTFLSHFKPKF